MRYAVTLPLMLIAIVTQAQEQIGMADVMRENGKIYVVVGVLLIIMIGLFIYLIRIDKKLSKLEKETKHINQDKSMKS